MTEKAWAYYSSASDDEITNRENHMAYHRLVLFQTSALVPDSLFRIWFRPKILVDVERVDFSTEILGQKSKLPVYIVSHTFPQ